VVNEFLDGLEAHLSAGAPDRYFERSPMPSTYPASGQRIVITGGTSGVGLETARLLAGSGARLTLVGSDPIKGAAAERAVMEAGDETAAFVAADLSSMAEVRRLAQTLIERLDRLDVLINNAGLVSTRRMVTSEGLERTFAVNYLAPFVLTNDLLALMRRSAPARVISLTAAVEPIGRLPFSDLQRVRHYGGVRAYAQSKKALAIFTIELARRLASEGSGVTANVVDPFLVRTPLTSSRDAPLLFKLARPVMIRPETAARWVVRAAVDPKLSRTTGRHFLLGHRAPTPPVSRSRGRAARLWDASSELTAIPRTHDMVPATTASAQDAPR
jgi:NAD(P)-dependent dehydrogenase (short-subunit alcohol dehydrogenase family)